MTRSDIIEANRPERRGWMLAALSLEGIALLILALLVFSLKG